MEKQFIQLCREGNLDKAKKFLRLNPDINISELAFRWACKKGHLEVAKWLLNVKPDINISKEGNSIEVWVILWI